MDFNLVNIILDKWIIRLSDNLWLWDDIYHTLAFEQKSRILSGVIKWVFCLCFIANVQCIHKIFKVCYYFSIQVLSIFPVLKDNFVILIDFFIWYLFVIKKERLSLVYWKLFKRFLEIKTWDIRYNVNIFNILLHWGDILILKINLILIYYNLLHINTIIIRRTVEFILNIFQCLLIRFNLVKV